MEMEILVHTSAPSRGPDDARYRTIAQAYMDFVPETIQTPTIKDSSDEEAQNARDHAIDVISEQVDSQLLEELRNSTQDYASWESYRADGAINESVEDMPTQEISPSQQAPLQPFVSPQLSFNSALNNADSPEFEYHITCVELPPRKPAISQEQDSADSWRPDPSTIADSQPDNYNGLPAFTSPTTMLELYLQQVDSSDLESQEEPGNRRRQNISDIQMGNSSFLQRLGSDILGSRVGDSFPLVRNDDLEPSLLASTFGSPILQGPIASKVQLSPMTRKSNDNMILDLNPKAITSFTSVPSTIDSPLESKEGSQRSGLAHTPDNGIPTAFISPGILLDTTGSAFKYLPSQPDNYIQDSPTPLVAQPPLLRTTGTRTSHYSSPSIEHTVPATATTYANRLPPPPNLNSEKLAQVRPSDGDGIFAFSHASEIDSNRSLSELNSHNASSSAPVPSATKFIQGQNRPQKRKRVQANSLDNIGSSDLSSSVGTKSQTTTSWVDELEIYPPVPATSSISLTHEMLITDSLHALARKMPIHKLYNPSYISRDLRPMERGYWLMNCDTWDNDLRKRNWNCLGNYVGKGMAGWGVWCVRDEEFGAIRVYCWGVVVEHIYLLLFMASESKVKRTTTCWIGGDGEVVIRMPSLMNG